MKSFSVHDLDCGFRVYCFVGGEKGSGERGADRTFGNDNNDDNPNAHRQLRNTSQAPTPEETRQAHALP